MESYCKRAFKRELYEQFARMGKALSSGPRIELLELLSQAERTVEELAAETNLPIANVSQHLQVLRRARMVEVRRQGLYAHYRLADDGVFEAWRSLRALGESRLVEIQQVVGSYLQDRQRLEPVHLEELKRRLAQKSVVLLDVRPAEEFRAGHIPCAVSIPIKELKTRFRELPCVKDIVAYCRGPYCVYSDEAVALLSRKGYRARRCDLGVPDWKANGLPVERGAGEPAVA